MSVNHKNMPDAERHEPKGISSAAAGYVYQADGVGSGTWTSQLATIKNRNYTYLFGKFDDISTASSIFIPNPILGVISKIIVTLQGAITVADSIVTAKINGVLVTGSSNTIAFTASAGGSTFTSIPSGANTVSAGGVVEVITDGASTTAMPAIVCIVMDVT